MVCARARGCGGDRGFARGVSRVGFVVLGVAVVGVVLGTWLVVAAYRAEAVGFVDYSAEMNAAIERVQPREGVNAAAAFMAMHEERQRLREYWRAQGFVPQRASEARSALLEGAWDDPRRMFEKRYIAMLGPMEALLRAAAAADYFGAEYSVHSRRLKDRMHQHVTSDTQEIRIGNAPVDLGVLMRAAAERGDWERFIDLADLDCRVKRVMATEPSHGYMIAAVMNLFQIRNQLAEKAIPAEVCRRLIEIIEAHRLPDTTWAHAHEVARTRSRGRLSNYFDSSGRLVVPKVESYDIIDDPPEWAYEPLDRLTNVRRHWWPTRSDVERMIDRRFEWAATQLEKAPSDWDSADDPARSNDDSRMRKVMRRVAGASTGALVSKRMYLEETAATLLMLRLEIFHAEHSRWPDRLSEAASGEQIVNPATGEPFHFVQPPEPDERRTPSYAVYQLWSAPPGTDIADPLGALRNQTMRPRPFVNKRGTLEADFWYRAPRD